MSQPLTSGSAATRPEKGTIYPLTSLRFFAAFYVVVYHSYIFLAPGENLNESLVRFLSLGGVSVSFFFLLSGYILAWVYLRRGEAVDKRRFYSARFARIYPIFALTLVFDAPFLLASRIARYGFAVGAGKTAISFSGCLAMLQAWDVKLMGIDSPNWSLSVETFFYLLFPFIAPVLWRLRGWRIWIAILAVYLAGQVLVFASIPHVSTDFALYFPALHLSTFAMGVLLARLQVQRDDRSATSSGRVWTAYAMLALAAGSYAAVVAHSSWLTVNVLRDSPIYRDGLLAPIFATAIWAFSRPGTVLFKLFSARWLVVLGEASYALYLIHFPIIHVFTALNWQSRAMAFPLYISVCILLSVASFYWIEAPARRWIASRLQGRRAGAATAGAPLA